ncbi:MAG: hypothetical protein ACI841_000359 [Planctomycetota bacterium]|jgi:hypothetical protein
MINTRLSTRIALLALTLFPASALGNGSGDLYAGGDDGFIYRGNAAEGELTQWLLLGIPIRQMVQDGPDLFVAVAGGLVLKIDIPSHFQTYAYSAPGEITGMALSNIEVFAGNATGTVDRYDRYNGVYLSTLTFDGPIVGLGIVGSDLLAATEDGDTFKVDLATDTITPWNRTGVSLQDMDLGAAYAYSPTIDGRMARINGLSQEAPSFFDVDDSSVAALEYFDGQELLVSNASGQLQRIDALRGVVLQDLGSLPVGTKTMVLDRSSLEIPGSAYCTVAAVDCPCGNDSPMGCTNSTGLPALLSATGSSRVAADDAFLAARNLPANQFGTYFMGGAQSELPFGDGKLCVGGGATGLFRFDVMMSSAGGYMSLGQGIVNHSLGLGANGTINAGSTWNFQLWYRDPSGPCGTGFNTSNAYSITFKN